MPFDPSLQADARRVAEGFSDEGFHVVAVCLQRRAAGAHLDDLSEQISGELVQRVHVFAKLSPSQKTQVIRALQAQAQEHTVGFLGNGINDAPSLRHADVGISVDTATDIARESSRNHSKRLHTILV